MKREVGMLVGGVAAILLSVGASAQTGPRKLDCAKAPDPAQCEAHNKALDICGTQRGPAHRQCIEDNMPPPDCSKARNPQRCDTMQAARAACKGKYGPERRECIRTQRSMTRGAADNAPAVK